MADINLEIAEKVLIVAKKLFKESFNVSLEYAKELISLEDQIKALKTVEPETPKKPERTGEMPTPIPVKKKPDLF